jgi:(2S)-methylsuccinyl-CoA dehydrogenase
MTPDLPAAAAAIAHARSLVASALGRLAATTDAESHQQLLYDLAHSASGLAVAEHACIYGEHGEVEARLATVFAADVLTQVAARAFGAEDTWGVGAGQWDPVRAFVAGHGAPAAAAVAFTTGGRHLPDDLAMVADTFRRFGEDRIGPHAEHVHRTDGDVPEEIIAGVAELGCFGLSIPEHYGGLAAGTALDAYGMLIATEELSRASLGIGGSLITRPEILARAVEQGGTEAQKQYWLPRIASGEVMAAVAVTEPDFGSDVAAITTSARPVDGGWVISGVKTWCTFAGRADVLMVLARTDPDPGAGHRGLSIFVVPKDRASGHHFELRQEGGGRMEGRAIATLGYRGMHSFEVALESWFVPANHLVGEAEGQGRGFYLQMAGFENGRLQTAARATGVMQAAYELAAGYVTERRVFRAPLADYELTRVKLGRMAATVQAVRQYTWAVGQRLVTGDAALEAAMAKAFACRAAEWVTREAMQLHGGYGYAEEYPVSRLFVDARVLSIFEGADETLCLRLIGRRLLGR